MVMKAELTLQGCGIGLRREHYDQVLRDRPSVAWFEVISENFMVAGGRPRRVLEEVRRDYPVGVHGVSLSIGSAEPISPAYLNTSRYLERIVEAMEQSYPAVRRILGRGPFGSLVRRYLDLHPPRGFDLGQVGRALDSLLQRDPLGAELPFLPDLARLEWQVWESFTARDEPPLAWSDLQELGAAAAIELPLKLWVQPIRLLFLLVKVQPRQLASRPGSIFDCRGGDESVASSNVNALGRCDSGAERPGGQANWRAAKRNANLLETSTHEKPFVDRYGWKPSLPEWAEAVEHQGRTGQVHLMTRREGGRGTSGKKSRLKVGTVPVTSRGWRKRQGHLL
jgi:hypothetical protein